MPDSRMCALCYFFLILNFKKMSKQTFLKIIAGALAIISLVVMLSFAKKIFRRPGAEVSEKCRLDDASEQCAREQDYFKKDRIRKFKSEKDFKEYIAESESAAKGVESIVSGEGAPAKSSAQSALSLGMESSAPERFSQTNTQVLKIDEPDEVKTDGNQIYFSPQAYFRALSAPTLKGTPGISGVSEPSFRPDVFPGFQNDRAVQIIKAFPASEISKIGKIEKGGNLLLAGNILAVFSDQSILGYDVSNPDSPKDLWNIDLKENTRLAGARLYNGKLYIVTRQNILASHPCPLEPLSIKGTAYPVRCEEIYYPQTAISADITYTAMSIDMKSGKVEDSTSFAGSSGSSVVYMSQDALYITYAYSGDLVDYTYRFFKEQSDLIPAEVTGKIAKLKEYDISDSSKLNELGIILQRYQSSLGNDERLKLENEMQNRMKDYAKKHKRELERTGIVKLEVKGLDLSENGNVPGRLLNQFSLDEYQGNLRVAVTSGGGWIGGIGGSTESSNDVYILNSDLKEMGSVQDLGQGEKIYSVRFLEDKGYVVTYKQVDPFLVIDLSNSKNPQVKGELKIPGYSSYLHPLAKNLILGVGKENNQVKVSLFDVSDPANPVEKSKYNLDEYWSEILNTQYAFLQDEKHEVFFIPGNKGDYIFSYKNGQLNLAKAVSDTQAKRAIYINDYFYLVGDNKITVLNENDWEKVKELEL